MSTIITEQVQGLQGPAGDVTPEMTAARDAAAASAAAAASSAASVVSSADLASRAVVSRFDGIFRPGDVPANFSALVAGSPESMTALASDRVATSPAGRAYRVVGANAVVTRSAIWVPAGRSWKCRSIYLRIINPTDPSGESVQTVVYWLDQNFGLVSSQIMVTDSGATVAAGKRTNVFDIPAPPVGAIYARVGVKTFGADGTTDIQEVSVQDVTDAAPSSAPLIFDGGWDASTNQPAIVSGVGTQGHFYRVKVAGSTVIDGESAWSIGDEIAFDGTAWEKIPNGSGYLQDFAPSDSTDGGPYAWSLQDAAGKTLLAVDALGRLSFSDAVMEPSLANDDQIGEIIVLKTMSGTPISINARTGRLMCSGLEIAMRQGDAEQLLIPVIRTLAGVPLGIDTDGGTYLKISKFAETWLPPATMFGTPGVFNIRVDGERGIVGTMQDIDGYTCDVYRQRMISSTTTVAIETEIQADLCVAQSHGGANSGPTGGPTWNGNTAPNHILMIENSLEHDGTLLWSSFARPTDNYITLAPLTGFGQNILHMALESLIRFERDAGIRNEPRVGMVSYRGSTAIEYFFPGSIVPGSPSNTPVYMHENALEMVTRAKACAANYPMTFKLASLLFIQGENNNATATTWYDSFASYIDTVVPLYTAAAGQSAPPKILIVQTGTASDNPNPNDNQLGQIAIARDRGSPAVSVVGPMYQYRVHNGGTSGIQSKVHIDDLGRMMLGEIIAIARDRVVRQGLAWNPLWPVSGGVTRVDNVITIPMTLPPGCAALAFETDYVGTSGVTNKGFAFSQTGGNSPVITSVVIDGTSIVVTLDVTPTGTDMKIDYARANNPNTVGWMTGRGTLYTPDARQSVWYRRGYTPFANPRHYCVSFSESLI